MRVANDSTGNTNIIYWNGQLLALAERGLPWAINHDTLETKRYNPFGDQVKSKTFSAHPKVDPYSNELVCWGYQAKGLGTTDVVTYSVDSEGNISNQNWFKEGAATWPHDAWVTENWIILASMPFRVSSDEELEKGSQHWQYVEDWPSGFIVCPRHPEKSAHPGWKPGETRRYTWNNGLIIHSGASWEEKDGKLVLESHYVSTNMIFPFWNPPEMKVPKPTGSYVRWTLDLSQPTESRVPDPEELMASLCDFPKTDERFLTRKQRYVYISAIDAGKPPEPRPSFNSIVKLDTETREALVFDVGGLASNVAEPVFVPRSDDAPEGDGYVIACAYRPGAVNGELVILDSNDFSKPLALVKLPFQMRDQVHGNWVPNPNPGKPLPFLSGTPKDVTPSDVGPLNRFGPR